MMGLLWSIGCRKPVAEWIDAGEISVRKGVAKRIAHLFPKVSAIDSFVTGLAVLCADL